MDFFFEPSSLAVVGASPHRTGANLLANALRTPGLTVYPVNPGYAELDGLPCFAQVADLPAAPDLALVLVPAARVPAVLEECAAKGVKGVMVQSAGFAEVGEDGRRLQERCRDIARGSGMRVWGPNCTGMVDVPGRRYFTFMIPAITGILDLVGGASLVVQSGMLAAGFLAELTSRRGIGVAKACSIGNRADVDECDVLEYLLADRDTRAVGLYLESLARPRRLLELVRASGKPIVAVLGGRSSSGAAAARSHTASLAGNARLAASLLAGAGVVMARDFTEMTELAGGLALLPQVPAGCRVAVLTFSGGAGILTCDLLERSGLAVAELGGESRRALAEQVFPEWMAPRNPVDLYPGMERVGRVEAFSRAARIALADPGVDALLIHYLAYREEELIDLAEVKRLADAAGKTVALWCLGFAEVAREFCRRAQQAGMPAFGELSRAVHCLAEAAGGGEGNRPRPSGQGPSGAGEVLDEHAAKRLLAGYGVPGVEERTAADAGEALAAARELGWPVVLKGLAPGMVHKSEAGLVRLDIHTPEQLERQAAELLARLPAGGRLLVQRQVRGDYELMAGLLRDPDLGPCVMLGRGGLLAELEPDVAFAPVPLDLEQALALPGRLRCRPLLEGYRGLPPLDRRALAEVLLGLGRLAAERDDVASVDLNPLVIVAGRPLAVDAAVVLAGEGGS